MRLYAMIDKIILAIQFRFWQRDHTLRDFEADMMRLGCRKTHTRTSVIFTTPNGGKIEVTDHEIIINPK